MKRKPVYLIISILLVFLMATLTSYGADNSSKVKELEFVTWSYGVETVADNNLKLQQMYPDIKVNHKDYSWLDYHDTMINRFVAGNYPDVLYGSDHWLDEWASAGWLVPLEDYFPQVKAYSKDVANYAIQGMTYKGKIYGMSYYADTMDFMYNKTQLDKAGFNKAPATWEEVYLMAKALKQKGIVQYPIIMAWSQKEGAYPEAFMSMVFGRHQGGAAFFDSKNNPVFNKKDSDAYVTLEWLRKAYQEKLLDPASLSTAEIDQIKSMQSGAHTFTVAPQYNMAELNKPNSGQFAGQFRIALMPGKSHATVGYVRFFAMTPAAAKKGKDYLDAVWKFLEYSAGKTNGEYKVVERWAVENGLGFAQLPLFDSPKVREAFGKWGEVDVIRKQAELARAKEGMTTWYGAWDVYTRSEIHKAILGQQSTLATLNNMAAKWKELKAQ